MAKYKYILWSLLALVLWVSSVYPVLAIEYGGIGGRPAYPRQDNPRSESIFIHDILPKQILDEGIKVINNSADSKTLLIYATDETPSTDGGYACEQLTENKDGVGSWIKLEKEEVTLMPAASEIIPFTIAVPENIDVGEHNGCLVIQEKKDRSGEAGLKLSFRTGIRVALTVPGEIIRILELTGFKVVDKGIDAYTLTSTVKNSGNTSIDANIKTVVTNLITQEKAEFGGNYSVLRNNPLILNFDFIKPFWGGKYSAKTIVVYNDGTDEKTLESQTIDFISWPKKQALIYIAIGTSAILLITLLLVILKIRRNRKLKKWQNYSVKQGESLQSLAEIYHVSWKEIVSVNKLKPPYELKIGQLIKVPPK